MSLDPASLQVLISRLTGIADEMGAVLRRAAYSPNIKERADCSCALFTPDGTLLAQAEHIPVHLGAMPAAVRDPAENHPVVGMRGSDERDVVEVRPARERVVEHELVAQAGGDRRRHRRGHRPEVHRDVLGLGQQLAVGGEQRR